MELSSKITNTRLIEFEIKVQGKPVILNLPEILPLKIKY